VLVNLLCLYAAVGAAGWFCSALSERRGRAIGVVFVFVLASFLLNFLAQFWEPAKRVEFLGILRYYRPLFILRDGSWPVRDLVVLLSVAIVLWVSAGLILARRIAFPLVLLGAGLALIQPCAGQSGTWTATGSLNSERAYHTATLLQNGMVLVAGGFDDIIGTSASAELYDPASGTWTATGSLNTGRTFHTATLLQNGMVLVAGGYDDFSVLASAELYDPASGTWTPTGRLNTARYIHTATLLHGTVLVAGGIRVDGFTLGSAEVGYRQR
jgi:hypothetical protein